MTDTGVTSSTNDPDEANSRSHGYEAKLLTVDDWNKIWDRRDIGFHEENIHEFLEKHKETLINGRQDLRIFFPLCGKAVDMRWLADMGHKVVGLDSSNIALDEFFQEQGLTYTVSDVPGFGELYKSEDDKISLYCGDLYSFSRNIEGDFDGIWDRASFVAINPVDRPQYSELLCSLMEKDCRYLLVTFEYDQSEYTGHLHSCLNQDIGPPHSCPLEVVKTAFDTYCDIGVIDSRDAMSEKQSGWGITSLIESICLMTLKQ